MKKLIFVGFLAVSFSSFAQNRVLTVNGSDLVNGSWSDSVKKYSDICSYILSAPSISDRTLDSAFKKYNTLLKFYEFKIDSVRRENESRIYVFKKLQLEAKYKIKLP